MKSQDADVTADIASLSPEARAEIAIEQMAKSKSVFGLLGEAGWIMLDAEGEQSMPIWPSAKFAEAWKRDAVPSCEPAAIDFDEFLSTWLPGMQEHNRLILLFPIASDEEGIMLSGNELAQYLREDLEHQEQKN